MNTSQSADVVIIGGGVIGSSTAYSLVHADAGLDVVVIEPDPSYECAATPRATGTVRRTFTLPEKVRMSNFAHEVYGDFENITSVDGEGGVDVQFRNGGYLYMAWGAEKVAQMECARDRIAVDYPNIMLLDPSEISSRFPSICTDGVDIGLFAPDDGWIDPASALQGFVKKAKSLGAAYVKDRVVDITTRGKVASEVVLESCRSIRAGAIVNCANCWAPEIASMVGMNLPIRPMRRMTYYFDVQATLEPLPLTRDIDGASVRPEGAGYIAGVTNKYEAYGFNWDLDYDWFNETVWPTIATRIPAFEAIKLQSCWSGHYDINTLDHTAIIGPWTGGLENFYVAAGFSGQGLQQAPAVGRAIKELLIDGGYQTIDLSRLGYQRVLDESPLLDKGPGS